MNNPAINTAMQHLGGLSSFYLRGINRGMDHLQFVDGAESPARAVELLSNLKKALKEWAEHSPVWR